MTEKTTHGEPREKVAVKRPVTTGWREGTLTRANELQALCEWVLADGAEENCDALAKALLAHLDAARDAARAAPNRFFWISRQGSLIERALSNLGAAEAHLLNIAPPRYLIGNFPSLLWHVQRHLTQNDPRRQEFERIAQRIGVKDPDHPLANQEEDLENLLQRERGKIVAITRAASSAAVREQVRVRSFRTVIVATTAAMTLLMIGVAVTGFLNPTLIPMCFAPEEAGQVMVVCPTRQSPEFPAPRQDGANTQTTTTEDVDDQVQETVTPYDLFAVELVGLAAAAVASAAAIRGIRGSSERYGLPVAMAALKLPCGAVTAFLGLLLMRGQFVPGLSALDTSAQILAWALVFGYAQQVFTRLVDRQGQSVLDSVRDVDKAAK
jgi:hypothetical protein